MRNSPFPQQQDFGQFLKQRGIGPREEPADDFADFLDSNDFAGTAPDPAQQQQQPDMENDKSGRYIDPAMVKDPMVKEYLRRQKEQRENIGDAEDMQDNMGYAQVAGGIIEDFANSQRRDPIMHNSWDRMGEQSRISRGEDADVDMSGAQQMADTNLQREQARLGQNKEEFTQAQGLQQYDRMHDPGSDMSKQARIQLAELVPTATDMEKFDTLTAAQVQKIAPNLIDMSKFNQRMDFNRDKLAESERRRKAQAVAKRLKANEQQDKEAFKKVQALRKELSKSEEGQKLVSRADSYENLRNFLNNPSAYGDLGVMFAYMKALDPGSVVREGEQRLFMTSTSVPQYARNAVWRAISGESLSEEQRRIAKEGIGYLWRNSYNAYKARKRPIERQAEKEGLDMSQIDPYYDTIKPDMGKPPEGTTGAGRMDPRRVRKSPGKDLPPLKKLPEMNSL